MPQNTMAVKASKANPAGTFNRRTENTTYIIGVHFSKDSKDTPEDKMKRLMREEVKFNAAKRKNKRTQRQKTPHPIVVRTTIGCGA